MLPPMHLLMTKPSSATPYLHVYVTFLVMPEGVRVEERFVAEGAHQPYSQVYLAHMSVNVA